MRIKGWLSKNIWVWSLIGAFVIWMVISGITGSISMEMLLINVMLASFLILLSIGQMVVITSGNGAIDLSIQYTIGLAAYLSSIFMNSWGDSMGVMGLVIGLIVTLVICAVVGVFNAVVNMYLKVPAMITTLSVGYIVYSCVLLISTTTTGMPVKTVAQFMQKARVFGMSPFLFVVAGITVLMFIILYKTKYGKRLHAIGQNRKAAKLAGVNVFKTVLTSFVISSVLAGFTGVMLGGYFGGAFQDMGFSYLLTSIAAPAIGGTSIAGGKSSIAGVITGALLLTFIVTFLNISRLPTSYQNLIQGALLIGVLIASVPKSKRSVGT